MRKLLEKEEYEQKKQRSVIVWGVVLVALMLFSTAGYAFLSNERTASQKIIYDGKKFTATNGYWVTNVGENYFYSITSPLKFMNISSTLQKLSNYQSQPLYIYSESNEAIQEINRNFYGIVARMQEACIAEPCTGDLPLKDCSSLMFVIKETNETKIYQKSKCVYIEGKKEDLLSLTDSAIYKIFTI